MAYKDGSTYTAYHQQYYLDHREKIREQQRSDYLKNRDARIEYAKNDYKKNKDRRIKLSRLNVRKIKIEVKKCLGGECSCCKIKEMELLSIDHVNNDGAAERR